MLGYTYICQKISAFATHSEGINCCKMTKPAKHEEDCLPAKIINFLPLAAA